MKLKLVFSLFFTVMFSIGTLAQTTTPTAQQIIAKYVEAIGGREANEKIKTRITKGTVELSPVGIKGEAESYAAAPGKSYAKISLAGVGDIIESFDGTTAWTINPIQGNRNKEGQELLQTKLSNNFYREINLDKLYSNWQVKGTEKVGDRDAYVLTGTPEGLEPETFYFDAETGLLLRNDQTLISPQGNMVGKAFYEDYREVDGVKIPHKIRLVTPQLEIITTITEVKNNVAVEDSKFAKPQ